MIINGFFSFINSISLMATNVNTEQESLTSRSHKKTTLGFFDLFYYFTGILFSQERFRPLALLWRGPSEETYFVLWAPFRPQTSIVYDKRQHRWCFLPIHINDGRIQVPAVLQHTCTVQSICLSIICLEKIHFLCQSQFAQSREGHIPVEDYLSICHQYNNHL